MSSEDTSTNDAEEISGPGPSRRGEEIAKEGHEKGGHETGKTGAGRPSGTADARRSTGVNAGDEDPIDPSSPKLPPA